MKIWITGENGFIARAFDRHLSHKYCFENSHKNEMYNYWRQSQFTSKHHSEIDIFDPTLKTLIERSGVDLIIHTATMIINEDEKYHWMVKNNIEGSYYIAQIARELDIPIIFIRYKNHNNNLFNWTQNSIISMFKNMNIKYIDIISGELFGPEDFHGTISQLLLTSVDRLDIAKIYANLEDDLNYTFIDDFLDGLDIVLKNYQNYLYSKIEILNDDQKTLEQVIDYMSEEMDIIINFDIKENNIILTNQENKVIKLENWSSKYPFEAALEITRDLMHDRNRK
ncbi:MAG: hypothetical protein ACOC3V_03080 [bacterium]